MPDSFDAYEYVAHLRARWLFPAVACAVAVALAVVVTLLLPKQYTATCKILMEPPGGGDPRMNISVSPIYLESLKTYEHFAASDSLFVRALDHFQLRQQYAGRAVEGVKRSVLKVEIPRNTKILEVSVKLPDPQRAREMALFIGEETVKLSRTVIKASNQDVTEHFTQSLAAANERTKRAEAEMTRLSRESGEELNADIASGDEMLGSLRRQILAEESIVAEYAERNATEDARAARSRIDLLRKQSDILERDLVKKKSLRSDRVSRAAWARSELDAARKGVDTEEARLREAQSSPWYRGERLTMVDPGIVPERPSSPSLPLNVVVALLVALAGSFLYLTFEYAWRPGRRAKTEWALRER
jgi:capsular polysaccharide biosynthesis protein